MRTATRIIAASFGLFAGFGGLSQFFDPLFRLYFSDECGRAMDEHVKTEFPMLRELLRRSDQAVQRAA